MQHVPVVSSDSNSARTHVYKRNYVSVGNRRARSKYINFSLLQVTFLIKRHVLPSLPLVGYIRLTESRSPLPVMIERENGATNVVGITRPKLERLTIHSLNSRTSLVGSDGGLNLQAVMLRTHQAR